MSALNSLPNQPLAKTTNEKWVKQYLENRWLNLADVSKIVTVSPFSLRTQEDIENPHVFLLSLMRKPEYFGLTAKILFDKTLAPFQIAILRELWIRPFPMLIGSRGCGKSFLLAVYAMLRSLFNQGSKIIIVGAAFRQAKVVFDYCQDLWEHGAVFRDIVGSERHNGPRRDIDRCTLRVGESLIIAIPLGDGSKIRGQRANIILADEFSSISKEIYETVVRGFAAVSQSPVEKYRAEMKKLALKEIGLWSSEFELLENDTLLSNQTVISGTAYYSFNHFYEYWKQYCQIVNSKGNYDKLVEIFNGEIPNKFNHKDYSVIRIPVKMLPLGFMDEKQIGQAKATIHSGTYAMEYAACGAYDTKIITNVGVKNIADISIGDMVLTHKGRFKPVVKKTCRYPDGPVFAWSTSGQYEDTITTANHPFYTGSDWEPLGGLTGSTTLAKLQELSGKTHLDIRERVSDWMECGDKIYPRHSQSKFTREELADIRSSSLSQSELAVKYNVKQSTIHVVIKLQRTPKNAIPAIIPLNYDFGLIVGYYAAEGSTGSKGKSVGFALDGHVNEKLESYVSQLSNACKSIFGFEPKAYKKQSVVEVTINQRLVVDFIKTICPGVSHTKVIDSTVFYSNPDFLKGFIVGYWNGDGHLPVDRDSASAQCVNLNLLCQIRLALSFFGIPCKLTKRHNGVTCKFNKKEYQTKPVFALTLSGDNLRRFKKAFYDIESHRTQLGPSSRYWEEGDNLKFALKTKTEIEYSKLVYNLEVEEDHSYSLLNATVHNCFATDSNGFFKRSLIESCVTGKQNAPVELASGLVRFNASLRGNPNCTYVMGVDPASESDNFSIVILECWPDHRRIVYSWTTTKSRHRAKLKKGLAQDDNFYCYAARKIRDLTKVFSIERIAIDFQGGGGAVIEALQDREKLEENEQPFYPVPNLEKPADTDGLPGKHIIDVVQFARAEWVSEANHGMRKDFEDRALLFPEANPAIVALALEEDKAAGRVTVDTEGRLDRLYDSLDDCVWEIEQMKDELASIVHTQTGTTMRDRWDTPETKIAGGKKGRLRKDRYSSLLMANMTARTLQRAPKEQAYSFAGGFAHDISRESKDGQKRKDGPMWAGPGWYTEQANKSGGGALVRRGR